MAAAVAVETGAKQMTNISNSEIEKEKFKNNPNPHQALPKTNVPRTTSDNDIEELYSTESEPLPVIVTVASMDHFPNKVGSEKESVKISMKPEKEQIKMDEEKAETLSNDHKPQGLQSGYISAFDVYGTTAGASPPGSLTNNSGKRKSKKPNLNRAETGDTTISEESEERDEFEDMYEHKL